MGVDWKVLHLGHLKSPWRRGSGINDLQESISQVQESRPVNWVLSGSQPVQ